MDFPFNNNNNNTLVKNNTKLLRWSSIFLNIHYISKLTLRHVTQRNRSRDNGKIPINTMLLSPGKVLVIEDQLTKPRPWTSSCWKFSRTCILQTQYVGYDYEARESRWSSEGTTNQLEEGICWFAWTVWENLLYSSTSGTRVHHKWIRPIFMRPHCDVLAWATSYTKLIGDDKK